MAINLSKYKVQFFFLVIILILSLTFAVIKFAKGYRIDFIQKMVVSNGILSINSNPIGANVMVDGKLKTATNNTLSLPPDEYQIEVKKLGFLPWSKKLQIKRELVTFADAFLFPEVPDLKPLTFSGVLNPKISPDANHLVYSVPLPFPEAGLWVIDLSDSLLFSRDPRQIAKSASFLDLASTEYEWSPNSEVIILELKGGEKYLLNPYQLNSLTLQEEISATLAKIIEGWQKESKLNEVARYKKVPIEIQAILQKSARQITFSPDNTKIMYVATASAQIPEKLIPPILSASTQPETRELKLDTVYIYDVKEDRNFEISNYTGTKKGEIPSWFPTSNHLVWISEDKKVVCSEYDGTNLTTIYSGSFIDPFVFTTPSSNRLVILAEVDFSIEISESPSPSPTVKPKKSSPSPTPTPQRPKTNLFSVTFR